MIRLLLVSAALAVSAPRKAGPASLAHLKQGQTIFGFKAAALYLNASDEPMGARFVAPNGMPVDVLFFASVPQVSVYARSYPVSEGGDSHTLEHLLIGKGRIGKYLNALLGMRLAEHTAATYNDLTNYQFHTAAGPNGFYELLEIHLRALLHPEFTDEEIRREVANLEVVKGDDGKLRLDEKGTVYNEMVSTMEKPDAVNSDQLGRMVFGKDHPLGRNNGGSPAGIRALTPADVRRFHAANYHLGPNMRLVAALPLGWKADDFLRKLGAIMRALESGPGPASYARLPPPRPLMDPEIRIGAFPSDDASVPQSALFAWKPLKDCSLECALRLNIALTLLAGGETSYLHQDLVDQKTRKLESGATSVSAYLDGPPMDYPVVTVDGLPVASVNPETLGKLRAAIVERARRLAELQDAGPELEEAAGKARSLISSSRRAMLKFMDNPPHFGDRGSGIAWHRHLDHLNAEAGFRKSVSQKEAFDRLLREIDSGRNPWKGILEGGGVLGAPYVSAVKPDAGLLRREKADKAERLAAASKRIGGLEAFDAAVRAAGRELEDRDKTIDRPSFVKDPPLTLDDANFSQEGLGHGRGLISVHFGSTPFTDIHLLFDLTSVAAADLDLLPLAAAALADVGVATRRGEKLDYVKARERWRSEIYGLGAGVVDRPKTGRVELSLTASASSRAEIGKAAEWLENYLLRRSTGAATRERLVDIARRDIQGLRNTFQLPEESWVMGAADAYAYQNQPAYMAAESPFTELRYLTRLRWRLEGPSAEQMAVFLKVLADAETGAAAGDRAALTARLEKTPGELAETLSFELGHLPPDSWRQDMRRLIGETRGDLAMDPTATLSRLAGLLREVLARRRARVVIVGSTANAERASALARGVLARLPEGLTRPRLARRPLVLARLRERVPSLAGKPGPVHVALVNNGTKSGVHILSAKGPDYHSRSREEALDYLAFGLFSGAGPHSFFMQTWSAGLAYSNGVRAGAGSGRARYYAERCPDLAQTMKFVVGLASRAAVTDPALVEYSLANAFADYRGAGDFSTRGAALASDLVDGDAPEVVRGFKTLLLKTARAPRAVNAVRRRLPRALGRVLVGYGPPVSKATGASAFVIGPEELLDRWEDYLRQQGEDGPLVRLYPRDFWPDPSP